jgi:hypothetical protein
MTANFQKGRVLLVVVFIMTTILGFAMQADAATIDISINGTIQNWDLTPGSTSDNSSAVTLNVSCDNTSWTVSVVDNLDNGKPAASVGRMAEYSSNGYVNDGSMLGANLTVKGLNAINMTEHSATLGPLPQDIESGTGTVTNEQVPVTISQQVATTDLHLINGDIYRVVITFVGVAP